MSTSLPRLTLLSSAGPRLDAAVAGHARAALIPDAALAIGEPAIAGRVRDRLRALGLAVRDVESGAGAALAWADVLVVPGGDPFALLARLRETGAAAAVLAAVRGGLPYVGLSAGALVAGPSLGPVLRTSPFRPAAGQPLDGLGLTDVVALPHHTRAGRAERHAAVLTHELAPGRRLIPLADGDAVLVEPGEGVLRLAGPGGGGWLAETDADARPAGPGGGGWLAETDADARPAGPGGGAPRLAGPGGGVRVVGPQGGLRLRSALPGDGGDVARVFNAAARAAWTPFLGAAALAQLPDDWSERIARAPFLVLATRDGAVAGFAEIDPAAGLLDTLYAHPDHWGDGTGGALLAWAERALAAAGHARASLWTEARNARALGAYAKAGWLPTGAAQERVWNGAPLRELELAKPLAI